MMKATKYELQLLHLIAKAGCSLTAYLVVLTVITWGGEASGG